MRTITITITAMSRLICALAFVSAMAGAADGTGNEAVRVLEAGCWRMLPVTPHSRDAFGKQVTALGTRDGQSARYSAFNLHAAILDQDRAAMLAAAKSLRVPSEFPSRFAETARMKQLCDQGL